MSEAHLSKRPGELHVFGGCVAALQQPGSAVHVHQTLVVVVVDGGTQDAQVELLGAGVVHVLLGDRRRGGRNVNKQVNGDKSCFKPRLGEPYTLLVQLFSLQIRSSAEHLP